MGGGVTERKKYNKNENERQPKTKTKFLKPLHLNTTAGQ